MKKNPKPSWWEEFKTFAIKGNAMALAVGTIIGGAFSTITKSLTDDIIMPIINIFLGGADFTQIKIRLPRMPWVEPTYETVVNEAGEEVNYVLNVPVLKARKGFIGYPTTEFIDEKTIILSIKETTLYEIEPKAYKYEYFGTEEDEAVAYNKMVLLNFHFNLSKGAMFLIAVPFDFSESL